jgi:hypothetical protein
VIVVSLTADLVVAQQHEPPAEAHFVLLTGAAAAALAILGVRWWRGRRHGPEEKPTEHDRRSDSTGSTEEE